MSSGAASRPVGSPWGGLEIAAVGFLAAGGLLLPVVGPLVGLVLVWLSKQWSVGEKIVGSALALFPLIVVVAYLIARQG